MKKIEEVKEILNIEKYVYSKEGNYPVLLTCPHDGTLHVGDYIDDRQYGVKVRDLYTRIVGELLLEKFTPGKKPYFVALSLSRRKLDVNRHISECIDPLETQTNPLSAQLSHQIYHLYHGRIKQFIEKILETHSFVFVLDLHGQSHKQSSVEIGYLLDNSTLKTFDFNSEFENLLRSKSSFRNVAKLLPRQSETLHLCEMMFGEKSFGSLLLEKGIDCQPNHVQTSACPCVYEKEELKTSCLCKYFKGGYTTIKYSKLEKVFALQLEIGTEIRVKNRKLGLQPNMEGIDCLTVSLHHAITEFLKTHLDFCKL